MTTKEQVKAATKRAAARARSAGTKAAKRLVAATDAALIAQGKAAKARQRQRAIKTALKVGGEAAVLAGAAAATVLVARAARAMRRG